jgi:peroxisomal enoyl-CoA hydratase 2
VSDVAESPARRLVGKEYAPFRVSVDLAKIRELAEALRDHALAARATPDAARDEGSPVRAPLTFGRSFWWEGSQVHDDLGFDWPRVVHGGQEFEYLRPLVAGDVLIGRMVVSDVYTKAGRRGGGMTFAVIETTYSDEDGRPVLITRRTLIETGAADGGKHAAASTAERKPRRIGSFESINPGDQAEPLHVGPLTRTDFVRYAGAAGDFNPNHHDEIAAIRAGNERPFGMGMLAAGHLGRLVDEWLGTENVREFGVRFVSRLWPGDVLTCSGEVLEKLDGAGESRVRCDLRVENDAGDLLIRGTAVAAVGREAA